MSADNVFSLEVLKARKGDCLLLHFGPPDAPALGIIDGGPGGVYRAFLRPRLKELHDERGLDEAESLPVDWCMLSHIDDDHVKGLIQLTQELVDDGERDPRLVTILDLWHNTFDDIVDDDGSDLADAVDRRFGPAALDGDIPPAELDGLDPAAAHVARAAYAVLASVPQGRTLRDNAARLGTELNLEFDGGLIVATADGAPLDFGNGLQLTVIGPMEAEVEELRRKHDAWVRANPDQVKALASYDDDSVFNLSSIVVLAEMEVESGVRRSILFTGDARGDKVLEGLELVGLIEPGGTLHVDVLKGLHHGSENNVTPDFFERITADHYVFSGNGEHGNPERATLEMLTQARGEADYVIHLTYPIDEIDVAREKDWRDKKAAVLGDWDPDRHGLAAFLADNPDVEARLAIVEKDVPHLIELGIELGTELGTER